MDRTEMLSIAANELFKVIQMSDNGARNLLNKYLVEFWQRDEQLARQE